MKTKEKARPYKDSDLTVEDSMISDSEILNYIQTEKIPLRYLSEIKSISNSNDKALSGWLNITEKTLRSYRKSSSQMKENIREHIVYLFHLMKLGKHVFGSKEVFDTWLNAPNFMFDNRKPSDFLSTITGIQFLIDRLKGIEYGDNA